MPTTKDQQRSPQDLTFAIVLVQEFYCLQQVKFLQKEELQSLGGMGNSCECVITLGSETQVTFLWISFKTSSIYLSRPCCEQTSWVDTAIFGGLPVLMRNSTSQTVTAAITPTTTTTTITTTTTTPTTTIAGPGFGPSVCLNQSCCL